jgi:hypothetical protein
MRSWQCLHPRLLSVELVTSLLVPLGIPDRFDMLDVGVAGINGRSGVMLVVML